MKFTPFYVWVLPFLWGVCCYLSFRHPGDEYGLWGTGSVVGVWIVFIIGNAGDIKDLLLPTVLTGICVMAVVGLILDRLRTSRLIWLIILVVAALAVCIASLASFPSYDRAISKNGSLSAYLLFSFNAGLYIASVLSLLTVIAGKSWKWMRTRRAIESPKTA